MERDRAGPGGGAALFGHLGAARLRDTKFSAGWGVYYDAISLGTITRQQDQVSLSTFFLPGGIVNGPVRPLSR